MDSRDTVDLLMTYGLYERWYEEAHVLLSNISLVYSNLIFLHSPDAPMSFRGGGAAEDLVVTVAHRRGAHN